MDSPIPSFTIWFALHITLWDVQLFVLFPVSDWSSRKSHYKLHQVADGNVNNWMF